MMALNRYRLRHLARHGNTVAKRVVTLLKRPDRLLGIILIGNTFANLLASSVATILAIQYFGEVGVLISTVSLTFIVLIFAETTPKTLAAIHPQRIAFFASWPLKWLLVLTYPLVWLVNGISNSILHIFGVRVKDVKNEALSTDELRTVVREASGKISIGYQKLLIRVLELEQETIEDIMVPRNEIEGIDATADWSAILGMITRSRHVYLPVYRENIDQVIGILNIRKILPELSKASFSQEAMLASLDEVYFVPEVTLLNQQLFNFQQDNKSMGLVVDEYGDIQGMVTIQDIVEEVVGEFSADLNDTEQLVRRQKDNSYLVDGRINLRDLNRITGWDFPTNGPKTLSGLIIELLEIIPSSAVGLKIAGYWVEVIDIDGTKIQEVKIQEVKVKSSSRGSA